MQERIAKPNLNHSLFFGRSNCAMPKIIAKTNHDFFKSNRPMPERKDLPLTGGPTGQMGPSPKSSKPKMKGGDSNYFFAR
jgi:hypothetical protein